MISTSIASAISKILWGGFVGLLTTAGYFYQIAAGATQSYTFTPGQRLVSAIALIFGLLVLAEAVFLYQSQRSSYTVPMPHALGGVGIALMAFGVRAISPVLWPVLVFQAFAFAVLFVVATALAFSAMGWNMGVSRTPPRDD